MSSQNLDLPASYSALPTRHISLSHVPADSPTPTKVIVVTLNRPEKYNAFTGTMKNELIQVFRLFDVDDRVRAIVLTGSGRMFCAGADLEIGFPKGTGKSGERNDQEKMREREHRDGGGQVSLAIHHCRKPTIAAINGSAVGIGITMTLPAAIRVISSTAKVGFVFSQRGLIMEAASSFFLPRLIGHSRALHLTTTGSTYLSTDPLLSTLFSEVLPTGDATLARALQIAGEVAENTSTVATSLMRDLMWRGPESAEDTHLLDSSVIYGLFGKGDNEEGVKSFLEKRKPEFKGSFQSTSGDLPEAYPWWKPVDTKLRSHATGSKAKL